MIPALLARAPDEPAIVMSRAPGVPCSTLGPSPDERQSLSQDYAEKVVALFSAAGDVESAKARLFAGQGAAEFRDSVQSALGAHPVDSPRSERLLTRLRDAVGGVAIRDEMVIKLDWNASNVFAEDGAITQLVAISGTGFTSSLP